MNRIYVVGFAPSIGADGESEASTGGFDWYETWAEACRGMCRHLTEDDTYLDEYDTIDGRVATEHDGFDYRLTAVDVPSEIWETDLEMPISIGDVEERRRQMITDWLDENRELWEPPQPEYDSLTGETEKS